MEDMLKKLEQQHQQPIGASNVQDVDNAVLLRDLEKLEAGVCVCVCVCVCALCSSYKYI